MKKHDLKSCRHIVAGMIDASMGYFTPAAAYKALSSYQSNGVFSCEWYLDMAGLGYTKKLLEITDEDLKGINRNVIAQAFHSRHKSGYRRSLGIVDAVLAGKNISIASWF